MKNRKEILQSLINLSGCLDSVNSELTSLPWDSTEELVILHAHEIISILDRYISGEITADTVSAWANLIECREDIEYEDGFSEIIKDTIFELANTELSHPLNIQRATEIKRLIHRK